MELLRVSPHLSGHVDEALREVARRLLGNGKAAVLSPQPEAVEARAACARYLHYRIQATDDQKPGRNPDMSPEAAAAMKAVLVEVGSTQWEPLYAMLSSERGVTAIKKAVGAAANHTPKARLEAATKLIHNHFKLLLDVCNPCVGLQTNVDVI